jgi:DNA-binding MarR family transcriptional regulator
MRAIVAGADNASALGRRLSISKQAAAKTIAILQERGYVERAPDPSDGRRKRLQVTKHGLTVLHVGEAIFDDLRGRWARQIGSAELRNIEKHLSKLVGPSPVRLDDMPGWMSRGLGE